MSPRLRSRARLVGSAFAVGLLVGGSVPVAVAFGVGTPRAVSETMFALGAAAFGFGLLGWSGSMLAGRGFEAMQAHLDADSGWTEEKSRRAMARVGGFGAGVMVAAALSGTLLGV